MSDTTVRAGDRWSWLTVQIDGDDLVVRGIRATNFGHPKDAMDNGEGSKGWPVALHPEMAMVALPYRVPNHDMFKDSPIPVLPVKSKTKPGAKVRVFYPATKKSVDAELADLGPNLSVKTGIDLSIGAVKALGLTIEQGVYKVDFRILGGALKLSEEMKPKADE